MTWDSVPQPQLVGPLAVIVTTGGLREAVTRFRMVAVVRVADVGPLLRTRPTMVLDKGTGREVGVWTYSTGFQIQGSSSDVQTTSSRLPAMAHQVPWARLLRGRRLSFCWVWGLKAAMEVGSSRSLLWVRQWAEGDTRDSGGRGLRVPGWSAT